jgi:hypothetical protein
MTDKELQIATTNIKIGFENGYKKGLEDGYKKGIEAKAADWLPDDELSFDPARPWWKCSHCYERTGIRTQFCPNCGYKMRCQEDG